MTTAIAEIMANVDESIRIARLRVKQIEVATCALELIAANIAPAYVAQQALDKIAALNKEIDGG